MGLFFICVFCVFFCAFCGETDPKNILLSSTGRVMFLRPNITYIRRGKVGLTADCFLATGKEGRDKYDSSFANHGHRNLTQTDLG
jgi:hypothetical protein